MPSMLHEALVLLFRNRPALAPELLESAFGLTLPAHTEVRVESAELTQTVPTEYRADLVVLLLHGLPVLAIVVEVQLASDADKRWTWPVYVSALRARLRCACLLFIVTADDATARWAADPIELGPPGFVLKPLVLRPRAVPIVTDPAAAAAAPELAVLSAMAHGGDDATVAAQVAHAAFLAVDGLDEDRARLYADLVYSRLGDAARSALEALMDAGKYEYQSDFAKKYRAEGNAEGRAEGEARGRAEGEARGRAEGEAEGKAAAVIAFLAARGIAVPAEVRDRILACRDLAELERWVVRAATVGTVDGLFAGGEPS